MLTLAGFLKAHPDLAPLRDCAFPLFSHAHAVVSLLTTSGHQLQQTDHLVQYLSLLLTRGKANLKFK
jgi:hypothetical protein